MRIPQVFAEGPIPDHINIPDLPAPPRAPSNLANMDAMPSRLAIPDVDTSGANRLFESMAQTGRALSQLGAQTIASYAETQRKKAESAEHTDGVERFHRAKEQMDTATSTLEQAPEYQGHRARVDLAWTTLKDETLKGAKSDRAKRYLNEHFAQMRVDVMRRAGAYEDKRSIEHGQASLTENLDRLQRRAVDATRDQDYRDTMQEIRLELLGDPNYPKDGKGVQGSVRRGLMREPDAVKELSRLDKSIRTKRWSNEAYRDPAGVLEKLHSKDNDLDDTERTNIETRANNRLSQIRNDRVSREAADDRDRKKRENAAANDWRQKMQENYREGAPGADMEPAITGDFTNLGEEYKTILAEHQARRDRFLKPIKKTSTEGLPGTVQYWIATEKLDLVSQASLLEYYKTGALDEPDHARLSGLLEAKRQEIRARAEKGQNESERERSKAVKDGEEFIEKLLQRGDTFKMDDTAQRTRIVVADTVNEYHRRLRADPKLDPNEVAQQLIQLRVEEMTELAESFPYKTPEDAIAAYMKGTISKSRAQFYHRVLTFVGKGKSTPSSSASGQKLIKPTK